MERKRYPRRDLLQNEQLDYEDCCDDAVDEQENITVARPKRYPKFRQQLSASSSGSAYRSIKRLTFSLGIPLVLSAPQSIGEPGTQTTLETFHFAGLAGPRITEGVPRINEIISASKNISTPVITCPLRNGDELRAARIVRARIDKTILGDILVPKVETEWHREGGRIILHIDADAVAALDLGLGPADVARAICDQRKLKIRPENVSVTKKSVFIELHEAGSGKESSELSARAAYLWRNLPTVVIGGCPEVTRAMIDMTDQQVSAEGHGLRACMTTEGVVGERTRTNCVMECNEVLGIEAARATIVVEILKVMDNLNIDRRHMELLAEVMTNKGEVLGITRFGLAKNKDSVLHLASFEKTADHLFDAAAHMKTDGLEGVSESIIFGQTMRMGTGSFGTVRRLGVPAKSLQQKPTLFEDASRVELEWRSGSRVRKS